MQPQIPLGDEGITHYCQHWTDEGNIPVWESSSYRRYPIKSKLSHRNGILHGEVVVMARRWSLPRVFGLGERTLVGRDSQRTVLLRQR